MDVCDDADYSQMLKKYSTKAKEAGVPAITSGGNRKLTTTCNHLILSHDADPSTCMHGGKLCQPTECTRVPAGIYPGVSNLMAAHMVSIARREYDSEWRLTVRSDEPAQSSSSQNGTGKTPKALVGAATEPVRVRYSYYTAGSGGVGPTILETSFLLAGTDVVVYRDGNRVSTTLAPSTLAVRFA